MSRPKPTKQDMEDVLAYAHARGLGGKFWDDQRRYLVVTLPEEKPEQSSPPVDTPKSEECAPLETSTPS